MASTADIIDAATKLGHLIAEHAAAVKYAGVVKTLNEDIDAQRVLTDYQRHLVKLSEKESQGQPIEVDDKRRLEELHGKITSTPVLRDLQMSQMDYLDLMRKVNNAITGQTDQPPADPGALGDMPPGMDP